MGNLVIVGNGFDIALGYYTRYKDFVNTWAPNVEHVYWPFKELPNGQFADLSLHAHFHKYFLSNLNDDGQIKWIDIESEILKYVKSINAISQELVDFDKFSFNLLKQRLFSYIRRIVLEMKHHVDPNLILLFNAIRSNGTFYKLYNFNYTDIRKELKSFLHFSDAELPLIFNIHGSILMDDYSNIVLGINDDIAIPKEYYFLFKSYQIGNHDLATDMFNADEIIIYGLSLGIIDFQYFQSFFKSIASLPLGGAKKYITIFTFGENSVSEITDNIYKMGLSPSQIKEKSYFNIIDMNEVDIYGKQHKAFSDFLLRLGKSGTAVGLS